MSLPKVKGAKERNAKAKGSTINTTLKQITRKQPNKNTNKEPKIPKWFQTSPPKKDKSEGKNGLTNSGIAELEALKFKAFNSQLDTLKTQSFRLNCTLRAQLHEVKQLSGKHVSQRSQTVRRLTPEQMQKRKHLVNGLLKTIKKKSFFTDLIHIFRDKGTKIWACDCVNLWVLNPDTNKLETIVSGSGAAAKRVVIDLGHDLVGSVAKTGTLCNLASATGDKRYEGIYDSATGYVTASICCIACSDDFGRTLALVDMRNKKLGQFDKGDEQIAQKICRAMAIYLK